MKLFRISKDQYISDLSGVGAKLYGGRWNKKGVAMVYCSTHLSLAVLELLANQSWKLLRQGYSFTEISLPDDIQLAQINRDTLPSGWRRNPYLPYTLEVGSKWLQKNETLGILVPSAVVPHENNLLLNPSHPEFEKVDIRLIEKLVLDDRVVQ